MQSCCNPFSHLHLRDTQNGGKLLSTTAFETECGNDGDKIALLPLHFLTVMSFFCKGLSAAMKNTAQHDFYKAACGFLKC